MKYISLETIEKARLRILPVSFQAESTDVTPEEKAYIDGWNECIDALGMMAEDLSVAIDAETMNVLSDTIKKACDRVIKALDEISRHAEDDGFLQALGGGQAEPADDVGCPDCEDCRISGLLTDD